LVIYMTVLTDQQKLDLFMETMAKLHPKSPVDKPMNSRQSDMESAFYEGIEVGIKARKPMSPELRAFHSKVYSHFGKENKIVYVYGLKSDKAQTALRTKQNLKLTHDIYYELQGVYTSPQDVFKALNKNYP
jgi:hypothetical protein